MHATPMSAGAASDVDVSVWRAIAGCTLDVPPLNSSVYYFPQGHLEHCSEDDSGNNRSERPYFVCRVVSIRLLSHPASDEVFVKYVLQPSPETGGGVGENAGEDGGSDVVTLTKVLTLSDANNGGGFSVPRSCADLVFPPLNFGVEPPVQTLRMIDTHREEWKFRHIYRGTPRRHLLTTGWSKFVNKKRLIAGDSVVFMRKRSTNDLFIGIRRARRIGGNSDWTCGESSSSSQTRGPLEAIANAARGMAFEVVYYPRTGSPAFIVRMEKVVNALQMNWSAGLRIKMAVEAEDSSRTVWFQGLVTAVTKPSSGPWRGSPWRMLEVTWNEPEPMLNMNRVNPWDVEFVPPTPIPQSASPPHKRIRNMQNPNITDEARMEEFSLAPTEGNTNVPVVNYPSFPDGMQGARQYEICIPRLPQHQSDNANQTFVQLLRNAVEQEPRTVSAVVSLGSPLSRNLSHVHQTGVHISSEDHSNQNGHHLPVAQETSNQFLLFGQIIHLPKPDEGCPINNVSETSNESQEEYNRRTGTDLPPHCSPRMITAADSVNISE